MRPADASLPGDVALLDSGELDRRVATAWPHLEDCGGAEGSGRGHNINLVTPTQVVAQVLAAVALAARAGLHLPLVYILGFLATEISRNTYLNIRDHALHRRDRPRRARASGE